MSHRLSLQAFLGIAHVLGILACHGDVAAEWDQRQAIVRGAALEAEQARSESEREHIDPRADESGCEVVAEFVDEDQQPDAERYEQAVAEVSHGGEVGCIGRAASRCELLRPLPALAVSSEDICDGSHRSRSPLAEDVGHVSCDCRELQSAVQETLGQHFIGCIEHGA